MVISGKEGQSFRTHQHSFSTDELINGKLAVDKVDNLDDTLC